MSVMNHEQTAANLNKLTTVNEMVEGSSHKLSQESKGSLFNLESPGTLVNASQRISKKKH